MSSSQEPTQEEHAGAFLKRMPHQLVPRLERALQRRGAQLIGVALLVLSLSVILGPSFRRMDPIWRQLEVGQRAETTTTARRLSARREATSGVKEEQVSG